MLDSVTNIVTLSLSIISDYGFTQSFLFLYLSILILYDDWHVVVMIIRSWNPPKQPVKQWYQSFKGSNNIKTCLYKSSFKIRDVLESVIH